MITVYHCIAAIGLLISAILHFISPIFGGVGSQTMMLLGAGIAYLVFAWGLMRAKRWVAYLGFVVLLIGAVVAFISSYATLPAMAWVFTAIVIADCIAIFGLFMLLWRPRPGLA